MKLKATLAAALLVAPISAFAVVCQNAMGTVTDVYYDLSNVFGVHENNVGETVTLSEKSGWVGVQAVCPRGATGLSTFRSYVTDLQRQGESEDFVYLKLNDYLEGAIQITDTTGHFYPPVKYVRMGSHPNVPNSQPFSVLDSRLVFRLKVTRRFVTMVEIPRQTMFTVYVTTEDSDPLTIPVYTISYSGTVNVPQSCEIDAGNIVEFDFGDLRASLFSQAGAGNRPESIMPQAKNIAIQCTNIAAHATLSLRLEASNTQGNIIISDNPDIGFVVGDNTATPLTPNTLASKIPFQLGEDEAARTTIRAWPVSVTGNKPAEGPFSAQGYLRVDYD